MLNIKIISVIRYVVWLCSFYVNESIKFEYKKQHMRLIIQEAPNNRPTGLFSDLLAEFLPLRIQWLVIPRSLYPPIPFIIHQQQQQDAKDK